jgi:UDP-N-acetylmuramoyl-L-alanyl-D-glutamate--2,6-diaminopimelate ligase
MLLTDIPDVVPLLKNGPDAPTPAFTGIACDSRRVKPGDLFVAIAGTHDDGAKYALAAAAKGAVAVVSETPVSVSVPVVPVTDARKALGILASAAAGSPSKHLDLFGITGTNGKTTTAWVLVEMLRAGGRNPGLLSTVQVSYGDRVIPATRTTPDACELQRALGDMVRAGCDSAVMEVSSHALDQQRVAALRFAGAAFTHLTQDHLDYHHTMEAYFEAKKKLFVQLARENPGAPAVCFLDAPYGPEMAAFARTLAVKLVTAGYSDGVDFSARDIRVTPDGSDFTFVAKGVGEWPTRLHLAGRYNIANILCAASLAVSSGVAPDKVAAAIPRLQPRWGRMERVPVSIPAAVFVDYAHTDDALTNVLSTLREMCKGRLTVVFGCGGDRDKTKRPKMGKACADHADRLIITSDNPRSEDPAEIIREILPGIPSGTDCHVEPDRRKAIRLALTDTKPGDIVLVAGKGHEITQEIAGRYLPFDDRAVVKEECARL